MVDEMRTGVRIQARAWVGLVRFKSIEVQVTRKLVGDALGLTRLLVFTRGLDALQRSRGIQLIKTSEPREPLELLATLLAESVERIVQHGLFAGYVEHEDKLAAIRGRPLVDR